MKAERVRSLIKKVWKEKKMPGTFFRIETIKRSTGEKRVFVANFGFKKYLKGGKAPYSFKEKNLLVVWDLKAHKSKTGTPIRSINCDDIISLQVCKEKFIRVNSYLKRQT